MKRPTALLLVFAILFSMFMGISLNRTAAVAEMDSNLARGKTVTSSSSLEASGWGTAKATDGVRGMGQNSNGWTSYYFPWMNHREWVAVDLGSVTTIGRVDLYSREINPGVGAGFPQDFAIMVSVDGSNWMSVREVTGYEQPGMEVQRFLFQPVEARFVKIEGSILNLVGSEYRMQLSEIEVYRGQLLGKPTNGIHTDGKLMVQASNATGSPVQVEFYKRSLVPLADLSTAGSSGFENKQSLVVPSGTAAGSGDTGFTPEAVSGMSAADNNYFTTRSLNSPYQRFDIRIDEDVSGLSELNVTWEGRTDQTATLYAWDYPAKKWVELDTRSGDGINDFLLKGKLVPSRMVSGQAARLMVGLSQKNITEPGKLPADSEYDFSFVWMTDTQFYSQAYPYIYDKMSQWIADNKEEKRIEYVLHTGDLVEVWNVESQWQIADRNMKVLEDADIPYGVVAGNHDINHNVNDYTNYWRYFGRDRFESKPSYGGDKDNNRHHYDLISAGGMDFVILYLGVYGTIDDETIAWANGVLQQYKDRYAIVGTHAYIDPSGKYGVNGKDIMEKIVAPNENVFLTVSGHYHGAFYNVKRMNGRVVYEVLSDYQAGPEGGLGYMRLLQFDAETKRMYMNTYSPYKNDYNFFEDKLEQATFPLDPATGEIELDTDYIGINKIQNQPIGTANSVSNGEIASIPVGNAGDMQDGWVAIAADSQGNKMGSDIFRFESDASPDDHAPPKTSVQVGPVYQSPLFTPVSSEPAGPWTNYAKHQNVFASSDVGKWGFSRAGAVDGQRNSEVSFGWTSYNDLKNNHTEWIMVDMGRVRDISLVDLYPRNEPGNVGSFFPIDFTIQVSTDNQHWTTVADQKNYPKPTSVQSFAFPTTAARYVKIEGTNLELSQDRFKNYHMQFAEIEIYGRDPVAPPAQQPSGSQIWHGWFSPINVTFTATDNKSGVASIEYSPDGGTSWMPYSGSFLIAEEGNHTILYRSTDQSGNREKSKTLDVKIDRTAPVTAAHASAANWSNQEVTVALTATDHSSAPEIQYSKDGGASWIYYSVPITVTGEGVTELLYRSIDYAGNVEPVKSLKVKIDRTAPELRVELDKNQLGPPNHKLVTVTADVYASDSLSGIASWSLTSITSSESDNGLDDGDTENDIQNAEFGTPDTTFDLRAERSGNGSGRVYTIVYTAIDLAGNTKTVTQQVTVPLGNK